MKLSVNLGKRSYNLVIRRGVLGRVGGLCNLGRKVMVVCDAGIPARYVKTLEAQCEQPHRVVLPKGDKSPAAWQAVLSALNAAAFGPGDMLAALGGGSVGDVAGFAAASYLGGLPLCQLPTSTTAQMDSALGGHCGLNPAGAPGTVSACRQPVLVAADPDLLKTLPPRHYAAGMAQALKTGLIASRELFELLEAGEAEKDIERTLYLCLRCKADLVEQDEEAAGPQRLLRFGYTPGMALAAAARGALLEGEAIALGMLPMIESRSLARRAKAVMKTLGLPPRPKLDAAELARQLADEAARYPDGLEVAQKLTPEELGLLAQEI